MKEVKFTNYETENINRLGEVLYSIAQRLVDEGKVKIVFLDDKKEQK